MKHLIFITLVLGLMNCTQANDDGSAITTNKIETNQKQWFENYISEISEDDWEDKIRPYLSGDVEGFIKDHKSFRNAFADLKLSIKHLVIEGKYAMAWMSVEAKHVGIYEGIYAGKESQQIAPTNRNIKWEEVWYFDIVGDKFGESWDFMSQDLARMKQLGIKEIPY